MTIQFCHHTDTNKQVACVNRVHRAANLYRDQAIKALEPLVGSKAIKVDGTLTSQFAKILEPIKAERPVTVYIRPSTYSIGATISYGMSNEDWRIRHEVYINLASIKDQYIVELYPQSHYRDDYTEQEVEDAREEILNLESRISDIRSAVRPFVK